MKELTQKQANRYLRILYPIWALVGMFSILYVPSTLMVEGNAPETARNIASGEWLYRMGIVGSLVTQMLFIFIPLLLYSLFKPINRTYGVLLVALALVSVPITMYNELHKLSALFFLNEPETMMRYFDIYTQGTYISHIFWGLWLFPLGWLAYKSGYFHKIVGIAVLVAGAGYVLQAMHNILDLDMQPLLITSEVMVMGELVFVLWIIIRGAKLKQ